MIFRSRITKALSSVIEQNAIKRSLFSSTSLMRTSVMTTVVLLMVCGGLNPTFHQEHAGSGQFVPGKRPATQVVGDLLRFPLVPAQSEDAGTRSAEETAGRAGR